MFIRYEGPKGSGMPEMFYTLSLIHICTSSLEEDPLGLGRFEDKYHLALELFEVRLMLEPEIAALASEYASEEEKAQLESLCDLSLIHI